MKVRLIADGESEKCNDFYNRIYGKNRTISQWRWEFEPRQFQCDKRPFVLVDDNGRIAGTQAFIPIRMIDSDGIFWTAKSEETLVDPDYRGQKLFEKMYQLLFDYADQNGLEYVWGFTAATKAFKRLGFEMPAQTTQLFFPFSTRSISVIKAAHNVAGKARVPALVKSLAYRVGVGLAGCAASLKYALSRSDVANLNLKTPEDPPEEAGELCRRFIKHWGGRTIYRDADYLRWRVFDNPYLRPIFRAAYDGDRLVGWAVYSVGDDGMGYLVDLMAAPDEDGKATADEIASMLLSEAVKGTRSMGAVGIRGWRVTDHPFDRLLTRVARRLGFYHNKSGHTVVLRTAESARSRTDFDRFDDWFVSRIYTEGPSG